jgi:hypothetical protein
VVETIPDQLTQAIEDLRKEVASLSERLAKVEGRPEPVAAARVAAAAAPAPPEPQPEPEITAEERGDSEPWRLIWVCGRTSGRSG